MTDASRWRFVYWRGLFGWKRADDLPPGAVDVTGCYWEFVTALTIDRQNAIDRPVNRAYDSPHGQDDRHP